MKGTFVLCGLVISLAIIFSATMVYGQNPSCTGYKCEVVNCDGQGAYSMSTGTWIGCSESFWGNGCVGTCYVCTAGGSVKICNEGTSEDRCTEDGVGLDCGSRTIYDCAGNDYPNCTCGSGEPGDDYESCPVNQCKIGP